MIRSLLAVGRMRGGGAAQGGPAMLVLVAPEGSG